MKCSEYELDCLDDVSIEAEHPNNIRLYKNITRPEVSEGGSLIINLIQGVTSEETDRH